MLIKKRGRLLTPCEELVTGIRLRSDGEHLLMNARRALFKIVTLDLNLRWEGMLVAPTLEFRVGGISVVGIDAPLLHVGEERLHGIEVLGLEGIELVVVALAAAE